MSEQIELFKEPPQDLKMYVWEGVLVDYTSGIICALARSFPEAVALVQESLKEYRSADSVIEELKMGDLTIYEKPAAVYCYGGG